MFELCKNAPEWYLQADYEKKRELLKILHLNFLYDGEKPYFELNSVFKLVWDLNKNEKNVVKGTWTLKDFSTRPSNVRVYHSATTTLYYYIKMISFIRQAIIEFSLIIPFYRLVTIIATFIAKFAKNTIFVLKWLQLIIKTELKKWQKNR